MIDKINVKNGFTLVELAIVLVIVGLLVGGTLAGQSLVEQAKIHKQIRALRELDLAVNTFRSKYGSVPGDVNNSFFPPGNTFCNHALYYGGQALDPQGNNDGVIDAIGSSENVCVWPQLYASGLYLAQGLRELSTVDASNNPTPPQDIDFSAGISWDYAVWPAYDGAKMTITSYLGEAFPLKNAVFVRGLSNTFPNSEVLTGAAAYSVDQKLDDGKPESGIFRSAGVNTSCFDGDSNGDVVSDLSLQIWYALPPAAYDFVTEGLICSFIYGLN